MGSKEISPSESLIKYRSTYDNSSLDIRNSIGGALNESLKFACYSGNVDMTKWLIEAGVDGIGEAFVAGCGGNQIDLVKWLSEYSKFDVIHHYTDAFEESCKQGNLTIAKWLYSTGSIDFINTDMRYDLLNDVCENDHLSVAEWLVTLPEIKISHLYTDDGYETGTSTFFKTCKNGWLDLAKIVHTYLVEKKVDIDYREAFYDAFISGQVSILDWLYSILEINLLEDDILHPSDLIFSRHPDDGRLSSFKWLISVVKFPDEQIDTYLPVELAEDAFNLGYRPVDRLMNLYEDYFQRKQAIIKETEGHEIFNYHYLVRMIAEY